MGILRDLAKEDIADVKWVTSFSAAAWKHFAEKSHDPAVSELRVEVNESVLAAIAEIGSKALEKHFSEPDLIVRISTLVVVANCLPPFSLSRNGKPVTSQDDRRDLFAKLTPAFVTAALTLYKPAAQEPGAYHFAFPDDVCRERFYAYLKLMDVVEVTGFDGKNTKKEEGSLKALAKDILGTSEFVRHCIQFVPGKTYEEPLQLPQ